MTCTYCGEGHGFKKVVTCYTAGQPVEAHEACWYKASKAAERATFNQSPIEVQVFDFKRGPREAKALGGSYSGATKTWTIPAGAVDTDRLARLGLKLVARIPASVGGPRRGCQYWTLDQGCVLHGETCSGM